MDALTDLEVFGVLMSSAASQYPLRPLLIILLNTAVSCIKHKNVTRMILSIEKFILLLQQLYPSMPTTDAFRPILNKVMTLQSEQAGDIEVRNALVAMLQRMNESEALSVAMSEAGELEQHGSSKLEDILGVTVGLSLNSHTEMDVDMTDQAKVETAADDFVDSAPHVWNEGSSFLAANDFERFSPLATVFAKSTVDGKSMARFSELPIWSSVLNGKLLWQTFLLRFACTDSKPAVRLGALELLLESIKQEPGCNIQAFIPYTLSLLSDDSKIVRRGAASLLILLQTKLDQPSTHHAQQSKHTFYSTAGSNPDDTHSAKHLNDIITSVIRPVLEECVLDHTYIVKVLQNAVGSKSSAGIKKTHRQTLHSLLAQHALATHLLRVKYVLVSMLTSGNSKTDALLPILQEWSPLSDEAAERYASESGLDLTNVDALFVRLANVKDPDTFGQVIASASSPEANPRQSLFHALFDYLRHDWKSWTTDERVLAGRILFDLAFSANLPLVSGAQDVLRSIEIPSEALAAILQSSQVGVSDVRGPPPAKRRRRSSSTTSRPGTDALEMVNDATSKIGLALELVDNNYPESKPELLGNLFEMLATLKKFQQNRIESPYLTSLCLSCLRAILEKADVGSRHINTSAIRSELVTDCLKSSDNPQVHNVALLVCASLSRIAPDQMLHNAMPIFTFIGHKMSAKDDEHSINVINEAIDKIVPALVSSLQKSRQGQALHSSMATVLASFTSAFDHIPRHRRVAFYERLLSSIGVDDFGFMLVALLAMQKIEQPFFTKFVHDLMNGLPAFSQLRMYQQLLALSVDALSSTPKLATSVFNINRSSAPEDKLKYVVTSLKVASVILQTPALKADLQKLSKPHGVNDEKTRIALHEAFSATLVTIQDMKTTGEGVFTLAKLTLQHILALPSLPELLEMLMSILDTIDSELLPQALRVLAAQLKDSRSKDSRVRHLALHLLGKLENYLQSEADTALVEATLICMDRVSEMFGRKDPDSVIKAANSIIEYGFHNLKTSKTPKTAILLTLASMVEVLKEAAVPIVPLVMAPVLEVLKSCDAKQPSTRPVFSAACALLSAVVSHVAFMVAEEQLTEILAIVLTVNDDNVDGQGNSDITQLTQSIARKVDLDVVIAASKFVLLQEELATREAIPALLSLCTKAIDHSSKTGVIKQADKISELFLLVLEDHANEIYNKQAQKSDEFNVKVSDELKAATIKFIYKINDTTFRPIFESWIDWATNTESQNTEAQTTESVQTSRQIVLFDLLSHFFETLKAIVTSYASYLIKPISTILSSIQSSPQSTTPPIPNSLLINTLTLLRTATTHDTETFFTAPSHFDPLAAPLIHLLTLSSHKPTRPLIPSQIIPTILSLATATQDTPTTHSTLANAIVSLRRHASPHVRLASIQTLLALTDDEDLGDEFIANTIGIGAGEGEGARGGGSSVGEIMIYVNEMLEDDDEDVERGVRRWVQMVREKVGEDIFEV